MGRFRQDNRHEVPSLNMAALPDLIFTVLFFFMIVTHMRQVDPLVRYQVPQGSEVIKDVRKTGLVYILIGKPLQLSGGETAALSSREEIAIQFNNQLVSIDDIPALIEQERAKMSDEERQLFSVCIRADRDTEMGVINDVKQALRRAGALNISYAANKKQGEC